jgi:hypothetical protein
MLKTMVGVLLLMLAVISGTYFVARSKTKRKQDWKNIQDKITGARETVSNTYDRTIQYIVNLFRTDEIKKPARATSAA